MRIFSALPYSVIWVSQTARSEILEALRESGQRFEVGGMLLGEKRSGIYRVEKAVYPPDFEGCKAGSFRLDGPKLTEQCRHVMLEHPDFCVLGIWHSHLYGISRFSAQDMEINRHFAKIWDGCISALAVQSKGSVSIRFFEVNRYGELTAYKEEYKMENVILQCNAYEGECCKDCRFYVDGYCQCKDTSVRPFSTACADFEEA